MALLFSFPAKEKSLCSLSFLLAGMSANAVYIGLRYWTAWPMLPMHLGAAALPLVLCLLSGLFLPSVAALYDQAERRQIIALVFLLTLLTLLFPKDYYLPFIKSKTVFSHFFLWSGVIGKACFFIAAIKAFVHLRALGKNGRNKAEQGQGSGIFNWVVRGFACWTVSMFAGEFWSYRGWGTPVVWDDPAITTTMSTWFFYICLLHLHLTGTWNQKARCGFAAWGGLLVLVLNCFPDLGPLRMPF